MPRRLPFSRRVSTAARWPLGGALTFWRYLWRTTPARRSERPGVLAEEAPPPLPQGVDQRELQRPEDGTGPLFHRRYQVRIAESGLSPEELMGRVTADLNGVAPTEFASFHKLRGGEDMAVDDEYLVRMPGPWDGPVRVVEVGPSWFRFATLEGHLEAGQIEFRGTRDPALVFTIESWARAGDRFSNLLYHRLRVSKEIQLHMWTSVLERVLELSGGRRAGALEIATRRVEGHAGQRLLGDEDARRALDQLHDAPLNFDPGSMGEHLPEAGWKIDNYRRRLPEEQPGPPAAGGSWEVARRLVSDYEFADPSIVRAVYHPDSPLDNRDMLLEIRFCGLRFRSGVRVGGVRDETSEVEGRQVRIWGWNYRTLQGHLEMGEMDYELWKWLDSGEVEFRIHVVSRPGRIANPLLRLGFRIFGRLEQRRFAQHACDRISRLTMAELEHVDTSNAIPKTASGVAVQAASDDAGLGSRMAGQMADAENRAH
jgi:uncharacterized protein (UPF0548 family)